MKQRALFLKTVASLVIVLFISSSAYAKKEIIKADAFRIKLNISACGDIKKELNKCLANELTSHNDVILVDNDAEYELSITAMETRVKGMPKSNIILSVIISNPFSKNVVDIEKILSKMNPFQASYMRNFFSKSRVLLDHQLRFVEPDKLTSICKDIAVDFDNKCLAKSRKLRHRSNTKTE